MPCRVGGGTLTTGSLLIGAVVLSGTAGAVADLTGGYQISSIGIPPYFGYIRLMELWQIASRILFFAVDPYLEMKVVTGRASGRTYLGNDIPSLYLLPLSHQ